MATAVTSADAGKPRILYLNRSDNSSAGGDHSHRYVQALVEALVPHAEDRTVQPYLRAHGKEGHIADRIIAMLAHVGEPGIAGLKWIGSRHDNPACAGLERTAGVTALAAWHLARKDFTDVALNPMGMAVEDIACAAEVYRRARAAGMGTWLDLC